jgi:cephalosporin hydroxylase
VTTFYHDPLAPVQPDQFAGEFADLLELYRAIQPRRVLEIGVREGGTLYQWIKHARYGAHIVAVEIGMDGEWANRTMPDPPGWISWGVPGGVTVTPILGDSHHPATVQQVETLGPYDFVFIDADHSYWGVACDFLAYRRMVRPGGMIALHDVLRNHEDNRIEIWKYWPLIRAAYRTQELTSEANQQTRGIGVVHV